MTTIGTSITMAKGTVFTSTLNDTSYQYVTNEDITTTPVDGVFTFSNVTLYEGTLVKFKYTLMKQTLTKNLLYQVLTQIHQL